MLLHNDSIWVRNYFTRERLLLISAASWHHGMITLSRRLQNLHVVSLQLIELLARFPHSSLHQRDPRASSSLFDSYNGGSTDRSRTASRSPGRVGGYGGYSGSISDGYMNGGMSSGSTGYRAATPNSKYVVPAA